MCLRYDIVYVLAESVFEGYEMLLNEFRYADSVEYHRACDELIAYADQAGDAEQQQHWRLVKDFATRFGCSPISSLEIDGVLYRPDIPRRMQLPEADLIRVVIGDPRNPEHEHQQPAINSAWQRSLETST